MKEYLPENEDPLNQISKKALIKLGVPPEPQLLYVLQLMLWQLQENEETYIPMPYMIGPSSSRANYELMLEHLDLLMYRMPPKAVMRYLQHLPKEENPDELDPDDSNNLFRVDDLKNMDPEDLAINLVDLLYLRMEANDSGFPITGSQTVFPMT